MHQLCGTDVVMFSKKRLNSLQIRAVKLIFPDTNTGHIFFFFLMRIMCRDKQQECNKGLFIYRDPEYISNMYTRPLTHYSNSGICQLSLPRPGKDIFKTSITIAINFIHPSGKLKQYNAYIKAI